MRNAVLGLALAGTLATGLASPASAGGYYYGRGYAPYHGGYAYAQPHYGYGYAPQPYYYRKKRNDVGAAIALGIVGAAAAAIIASQHNKPRRYHRYR